MQNNSASFDLSDKSNSQALMILLSLIVKTMQDESKASLGQEMRALLDDLNQRQALRPESASGLSESISQLAKIVGL